MYMHFALIGPRHWAVLSNRKRVAEIALEKDGRFKISTDSASMEDLDAIQTFANDVHERLNIFALVV